MINDTGGLGSPGSSGQQTVSGKNNNKNIDMSVDKNELETDRLIDFNNKYRSTDKGPYFVFIEHKDKNLGRLFPIRVGHYLTKTYNKSILDIKSVGINRVKVILNTYEVANSLIDSDVIKQNNLIAYIPKIFTQKKGVIRNVDTFFDEKYLLESVISEKEVVEVKRMVRRIVDREGKTQMVKRQIIILSFLGNTIPNEVKINSVIFPVEPYIHPVVQCFKCLRYGHTKKIM